MTLNFLNKLNSEQKKAVSYTGGPSIVLAGAGSGKTRVLTYKAMYYLMQEKVNPENILMLTFTNKAADEMKNRIIRYIDHEYNPEVITATTFHSFSCRMLRRFGNTKGNRDFAIFDSQDQQSLVKEIVKDSQFKIKISPNSLLYKISEFKNRLILPDELIKNSEDIMQEVIAQLYLEYNKRLINMNALDFDDLLLEMVTLLSDKPKILKDVQEKYRYLLIDEYQDTNHAQYLIAKKIAEEKQNITIVGDFSQSIYSWRGADFENLEKFRRDFNNTQVFNLEQNYRSSQPILDFAYSLISKNVTHPILKLWTEKKEGNEVIISVLRSAEEEAQFVVGKAQELNLSGEYSLSDMAILYRTNAQSRVIEEACLNLGLPYKIYGGFRFYERKEIKDILAFLRYMVNKKDKVSLSRIYKLGKRRAEKIIEVINKQDLNNSPQVIIQNILKDSPYMSMFDEYDEEDTARIENIQELVNVSYNFKTLTEFLDTVVLIETGYEFDEGDDNRLSIMTLHSAKGLEFSTVFIVGVEEGILPHSRSVSSLQELEEERRLFYVGITRAKKELFITHCERRFLYGRVQYNSPSQFLIETGYVEY
jgi:DNA helicase II / ATP-dependent DNA helicase PcrA